MRANDFKSRGYVRSLHDNVLLKHIAMLPASWTATEKNTYFCYYAPTVNNLSCQEDLTFFWTTTIDSFDRQKRFK